MPATAGQQQNPAPKDIYLSAPYNQREEMIAYAQELQLAGHNITSKWIHGDHHLVPWKHRKNWTNDVGTDDAVDPNAQPIALEDYENLKKANTIIFFSRKPSNPAPRGSRHVEFGIALEVRMDILVIGPRENLFHTMPGIQHWPSWEEFKQEGPCFPQNHTNHK